MIKPNLEQVPSWYHGYIEKVKEEDLSQAFAAHGDSFTSLLQNVPPDKWNYRYADGKWSVKQLVQHVIDSDRIFCYRALTFARKDTALLPGFDENNYASASKAERRNSHDLVEELKAVEQSSSCLFASFDEDQLASSGIANDHSISVVAIGFIIIGHTIHHMNILKERYLPGFY